MFTISRPPWFYKTIERISKYQERQRRATFLREEIAHLCPKTTPVYSLAPSHSGTSDQVANLAQTILDKQEELRKAENEIYLIDVAIGQLSEEKQLIIKERYIQGNKDAYVRRLLKRDYKIKSKDKYYSLKDKAVEELARTFGYLKEEGKERTE